MRNSHPLRYYVLVSSEAWPNGLWWRTYKRQSALLREAAVLASEGWVVTWVEQTEYVSGE